MISTQSLIDYLDIESGQSIRPAQSKTAAKNLFEESPPAADRPDFNCDNCFDALRHEVFQQITQQLRSKCQAHEIQTSGLVNEFFINDAFFELFPRIHRKLLQMCLDNMYNHQPPCKETGYMRRLSIKEFFARLDGSYKLTEGSSDVQRKKLVNVPRNLLPLTEKHRFDAATIYRLDHGITSLNGTFIYPGTVLECKRPELKDTAIKLLKILSDIKSVAVKEDPNSRDAKLPAVAPLLKLAAIQDTTDTGLIDEDLYVNVLQEAFPSMTHEELYVIISLGRTGEPRSRQIDYAKFVSALRARFETPPNT